MKKIGIMSIPETTKAILWDMDGVLIDSLGLDVRVVNELLEKYLGQRAGLSREYIASIFAYSIPEFWRLIFEKMSAELGISSDGAFRDAVIGEYTALRQRYPFALIPGVTAALADARMGEIKNAVVSNNLIAQTKEILARTGIIDDFDLVVGNDSASGLKNKPAPDMYSYALAQLNVDPKNSVVVEDSLIGAEAGKRAGCFVVGTSSGSLTKEQLIASSRLFDLIL